MSTLARLHVPERIVAGQDFELRLLLQHPMETGQRKDPKTNQPYPAHFIQQFTVELGGKLVVQSQTNTSVATNPVFGFKVKGAKAGDKVVVKASTAEERTAGGIVLPDAARERPQQGTVVAVGPGRLLASVPVDVEFDHTLRERTEGEFASEMTAGWIVPRRDPLPEAEPHVPPPAPVDLPDTSYAGPPATTGTTPPPAAPRPCARAPGRRRAADRARTPATASPRSAGAGGRTSTRRSRSAPAGSWTP